MIHILLKNLLNRWRSNVWLFVELILVTIVMWHLIAPICKYGLVRQIPLGYNTDRLYRVVLEELPNYMSDYQPNIDYQHKMLYLKQLTEILRQHPNVAKATMVGDHYVGSGSRTVSGFQVKDSIISGVHIYPFYPQSDYFQTFQFEGLGNTDLQRLDQLDLPLKQCVAEDFLMQKIRAIDPQFEQQKFKLFLFGYDSIAIAGQIKNTRHNYTLRGEKHIFIPDKNFYIETPCLYFRLKDGVNAKIFEKQFPDWSKQHLCAGNFRVQKVESQREALAVYEISNIRQSHISLFFCLFFLINALLGVAGSFWMQTNTRKEEIGIHRVYGGSRSHILSMFWKEATLLCCGAVAIGCLIYLQYALFHQEAKVEDFTYYWFDNFALYYLFVSAIVCFILLSVVWIGIFIPTWTGTKKQIIEVLHEE